MRYLSLISIMLLICTVAPIAAQDAAPYIGWPIVQRCVGDPTSPPDDWTYDGTILYQGEYGIHGLRSDWPTSRVLAFTNVASPGNYIMQGTLSPDKRWYAAAEVDSYCTGSCMSASEWVYSIHVFDLSGNNPRNVISIPWKLYYGRNTGGTDRPKIAWFDNEHIIYPFSSSDAIDDPSGRRSIDEWIANLFTGEMRLWEGHLDLFAPYWHAPDFSRTLDYTWSDDYEVLYRHLINAESGEQILTVEDELVSFLPAWSDNWSPDSSKFLAVHRTDNRMDQLTLYDRDGNVFDTIMDMPSLGQSPGYFHFWVKWSPNNRYIAMRWGQSVGDYYVQDFTTYVIDLEQKQVADTCIGVFEDFEWSPTSDQLIFDDSGLFDLNEWKLYELDVDGFVLGWRDD